MTEPLHENERPLSKACAVVGEDVMVWKPGTSQHRQLGKICQVKGYGNYLKISAIFDGHVYSFCREELRLA